MLNTTFSTQVTPADLPTCVWCTPFTPEKTLPEGKDIWLVSQGKSRFPAYGDYAAKHCNVDNTIPAFLVGKLEARLTQDGKLTAEGLQYCTDYGVQKDIDSLAKFTNSCKPKTLKYEGLAENQPTPAYT